MSAERILERAAHMARGGLKNPLQVLVEVAKCDEGDGPGESSKALLAAMTAAGGSLVGWYGPDGKHRTTDETARLFEEALFSLHLGL